MLNAGVFAIEIEQFTVDFDILISINSTNLENSNLASTGNISCTIRQNGIQ